MQDNKCASCSAEGALVFHHIIALEHGGTDAESNIQALCIDCHKKAHTLCAGVPERTYPSNYLDSDLDSNSDSNLTPNNTPAGEGYTQEFEAVWKLYPNKKSKGRAFKAFRKAKKKVPVSTITEAIEKQKSTLDWTKDGGQYIPMFSSWLNGDCWNNDIASMNRGKIIKNRSHERDQFSFPEGEEISNEM